MPRKIDSEGKKRLSAGRGNGPPGDYHPYFLDEIKMPVRHVFVYGSLRPDDDSGQSWTRDAVEGMNAQRAVLRKAQLFRDKYACAVINPCLSNKCCIQGYVLSSSDDDLFCCKLKLFDQIEGFYGSNNSQNLYERDVMEVQCGQDSVKAYVYHRAGCSREHLITSGDWLKRNEGT